MWVLIAVALWLIIGSVKGYDYFEKSKQQYNERVAKEKKKEWMDRVTHPPMESKLASGVALNKPELMKEVADSWYEYFGEKAPGFNYYRGRKNTTAFDIYDNYATLDTYLRILMANRGYLTKSDAMFGMAVRADAFSIGRMNRFMNAINQHLAIRGVHEPPVLRFSTNASPFVKMCCFPVSEMDAFEADQSYSVYAGWKPTFL